MRLTSQIKKNKDNKTMRTYNEVFRSRGFSGLF